MEKDFQAGKAFPDLPIIRDTKAFQVIPSACHFSFALKAPREAVTLLQLCTVCCSVPSLLGTEGSGTLCCIGRPAELSRPCCPNCGIARKL